MKWTETYFSILIVVVRINTVSAFCFQIDCGKYETQQKMSMQLPTKVILKDPLVFWSCKSVKFLTKKNVL